MLVRRSSLFLPLGLGLVVAAGAAACGESPTGLTSSGGSGGSGSGQGGSGNATAAGGQGGDLITVGSGQSCVGLECQQMPCAGGVTTTVTGVVYEPAGKIPLYNVVVYVPNAPLDPIPEGASCDKCGSTLSGNPLVTAITDTKGQFVLENVPVGSDIPLVIQVGKWRRQLTIPSVAACQDNPITDPQLTRLPASQKEGDLPRIALTTGGADPLECLLRKIGIADEEFGVAGGTQRVHFFGGHNGSSQYDGSLGGAQFPGVNELWDQTATLMPYDIVLLACDGTEDPADKPPEARQALFDYTAAGGRVFASHWNNYFLEFGPDPFPATGDWNHQADLNSITALVDMTFPKGQALGDWLLNVNASPALGEIPITAAQHTVDAANPPAQRWIFYPSPNSVQYFTFNTPIGIPEEEQCGRVVYSDIHVSSADEVGQPFPNGCTTTDLSPQEKVLLFMLFDLSSCIIPDEDPPIEPPT
jgi:hypothetical protein